MPSDVGFAAEVVGLRQRFFAFPSSDPFKHRPPPPGSSPSTSQSSGARFRFRSGNLHPVVLSARASTLPFRRPTSVGGFGRRWRFDSMTSSSGLFPVWVAGGGGEPRLIFILIPLSTMVARWSADEDIFCAARPPRRH